MRVADTIADILAKEGVRVAAGIVGNSIQHVAEAMASRPEMQVCYARSERVAADIADGYARVTGEPAVVFADHGPGAANAMAGIVNSWGDSTPIIFLAGHNPRFEVPGRLYKEFATREIYRPVSKWTATVLDPSQVEQILRRAFVLLRSGRPGPIVLELPEDVTHMDAPAVDYRPIPERRFRSAGNPAEVEQALRILAEAKNPYVYVGAGALFSEATPELVELAELLSLPVATTLNGKSAFPENHPLSLGIGAFARGTYDTLQAARFAEAADVVVTLGCGFKKHVLYGPMPQNCFHVQVDVDPSELHKEARSDMAILGDAKLVLQQMLAAARSLLPEARLRPRPEVAERIAEYRREWMATSEPMLSSDERPINPFRVTHELNQLLDPDRTIMLHDAGSVRGTTCQHYTATLPHSFIGYGVESAMGWTLGAAIGAKLAAPDKTVVAVTGDEAFGETALDLDTSVRIGAPFLTILKNNQIDRATEAKSSPAIAALRGTPGGDYTGLARSLGVQAVRVEDAEDLNMAILTSIEHVQAGRSAMVEVVTKRVQPSFLRGASTPAAAATAHL